MDLRLAVAFRIAVTFRRHTASGVANLGAWGMFGFAVDYQHQLHHLPMLK